MKILLAAILCSLCVWGYSTKGMVTYKKLCSLCHGPAFKGAAMLNSDEWDEMFADDARRLKAIHKKDPKALEKLNGSYFERHVKYLAPFLRNNGRDTGAVRSCDGLNCG